jgi:hypothetical protein
LDAGVAQLVEQLIRNEKVEGSIPFSGTNQIKHLASDELRGFVVFGLCTCAVPPVVHGFGLVCLASGRLKGLGKMDPAKP